MIVRSCFSQMHFYNGAGVNNYFIPLCFLCYLLNCFNFFQMNVWDGFVQNLYFGACGFWDCNPFHTCKQLWVGWTLGFPENRIEHIESAHPQTNAKMCVSTRNTQQHKN